MAPDHDPELDLLLVRDLNAPRDIIWDCWTKPEHLVHWFVPKPHKVVDCELDVRVGGACNTTFDVDGARIENKGVYLEVVPQERLVFTDTYTTGWKPAPDPYMTAILSFDDLGDGRTRYTALVRHRTAEAAKSHSDMGFHEGWGAAATQLEAYAQGLSPAADDAAARTMQIERVIAAPVAVVWGAWLNPDTLPMWWGPDGFTCHTQRIALGAGGEWVFDMIGPDGTVYPNHHRYTRVQPLRRIEYALHWGENGPKHADAWVTFDATGDETRVTLGMVFVTAEECDKAKGFGAEALGLQTLGKLARFVGAD
jgi:uncharacterized protein YndB with AHSA1/START domain